MDYEGTPLYYSLAFFLVVGSLSRLDIVRKVTTDSFKKSKPNPKPRPPEDLLFVWDPRLERGLPN